MSVARFAAKNEARNTTLVRRVRRADSFLARLRGLTFRSHLDEDEGLLLVGRRENRAEAAIHMFFVFFPIGVLWLDRQNRVVDKTIARPFRPYYAPQSPATSVLECRPEVIDGVDVGEKILFVPSEDTDEV